MEKASAPDGTFKWNGQYHEDMNEANKKFCTDLFMTASKSWTQIATKLKSIPNMYSQKFCALIFLEGRFLMITWIIKNMKEYITFLKKLINILYQMYFPKKTIIQMKRGAVVWIHKLLYILLQNHLEEPSPAKKSIQVVVKHFL
jgi:hypothetical protein